MIDTFYKARLPVTEEISQEFISQIDGSFAFEVQRDGMFLLSYGESPQEAVENIKSLVKLIHQQTEKRVEAGRIEVTEMTYREFLTKHREFVKPVKIQGKLVVLPYRDAAVRGSSYRGMIQVLIDSGMAFGTGMHPTTQLSLKYLANMDLKGKKVADAGTGSGILAVAAAKLGAESVYAFDIDELAVEAASRNAKLNGVSEKVIVLHSGMEILAELDVDVLIANLTEKDIIENKSFIINSPVKQAGLSGFLLKDAPLLADIFKQAGFRIVRTRRKNGWALLELERG